MVSRIGENKEIARVGRRTAGATPVIGTLLLAWSAFATAGCEQSTSTEGPGTGGSGGSGGAAACQEGQTMNCACGDGTYGTTICQNGSYGACAGCPQSTAGTGQGGLGGVAGGMGGTGGSVTGGTGGESGGTGGTAGSAAGTGSSDREKPVTCAGLAGMELTVCSKQLSDEIPMGCENLTGDAQAQCCNQVFAVLMDSVALAEHYPECATSNEKPPQVGPCTLEESATLDATTTGNPVSSCFFGPDGPAGSQGCDAQHGALADDAVLSRCMPDCLIPATGVSQVCADCFGQAQVQVNNICYKSGQCSPIDLGCTVGCIGTTFTDEYDKCYTRE